MKTINQFVAIAVASVAFAIFFGTPLHAASIVKVTYTQNGNEVASMIYTGSDGGPGSDRANYWKLLSKAPESAYKVQIEPDQADGKTATLEGDVGVSIEIRNQFNMGIAKTKKLTLIRDNAKSPTWYLSAKELKRVTALVVSAREMAAADAAGKTKAKLVIANHVYVKVFLPTKPPTNDKRLVESWVLQQLNKQGVEHLRAVTGWVKVPAHEAGEYGVEVWNATVDGKGWGCSVDGMLSKLRPDGKVKVELTGWEPFSPTIKGNTLRPEAGNRRIAVVEAATRRAYFAILVTPPRG